MFSLCRPGLCLAGASRGLVSEPRVGIEGEQRIHLFFFLFTSITIMLAKLPVWKPEEGISGVDS